MEYLKAKNNNKTIIITIIIILIVVIIIFYITLINLRPKTEKLICGLKPEEYQTKINHQYQETFEIKDYLYFGESLNLFEDQFDLSKINSSTPKTLILRNICDQKEHFFVLNKNFDLQVNLNKLPIGIYELIILDNLKEKRIITTLELASFKTLSYQDNYMEVDFFKNDQNYLFLKTTQKRDIPEKIDIYVDGSYNYADFTSAAMLGYFDNGYWSHQLTYDFAKRLCDKFNQYSFKCKTTRDKKEKVVNIYGEGNRLYKAYHDQAKYYLNIQLLSLNDKSVRGMHLEKSNYSSGRLENLIMNNIFKVHDFALNYGLNINKFGVMNSSLINSDTSNDNIYDGNFNIREAGGKALGAGMITENSRKNQSFAMNNIYSMHSLSLNLGYITNSEDVSLILEYQDQVIDAIVQAFIKYIN